MRSSARSAADTGLNAESSLFHNVCRWLTITAVAATVDGTPVAGDRWQTARRAAGLPETVQVHYRSADELPVTGTVKVRRHRLAGAMPAEEWEVRF